MEIQKSSEGVIEEELLDVIGEITFECIDSFGPMSSLEFDWFIQFVSYGFPFDNDNVSHCMQVIALVMNDLQPFLEWSPH